MKYKIEVKESISKISAYTVEVESEEEADCLLSILDDDIEDAHHPDDIACAIENAGYEILGVSEGAEDVEYEIY